MVLNHQKELCDEFYLLIILWECVKTHIVVQVEVRGQLAVTFYILLPRGPWGLNSDPQFDGKHLHLLNHLPSLS